MFRAHLTAYYRRNPSEMMINPDRDGELIPGAIYWSDKNWLKAMNGLHGKSEHCDVTVEDMPAQQERHSRSKYVIETMDMDNDPFGNL